MAGGKNLWKISTTERLQVWPKTSRIRYLSKPTKFMPARFVNRDGISAPRNVPFDIPAKESVESAAFATHGGGYYIMRRETEVCEAVFVLRGHYNARINGEDFKIGRGSYFVLPANSTCRDSIDGKSADILWFRFHAKSAWAEILGRTPYKAVAKNLEAISALAKIYADEAHSQSPSPTYLQDTMRLLAQTLRREFAGRNASNEGKAESAAAELARKIVSNPSKRRTRARAAKSLKTPPEKLDAAFKNGFGMSYAKFARKAKMEAAAKMLSENSKVGECAKKLGYADAYSFSNSFKSYYGMSPKKFRANASGKAL